MITSDQAKTLVILGVSAFAVFVGMKIYGKVKSGSGSVMEALHQLATEADNAVTKTSDSFNGFLSAFKNERLYRGEQGNGPYQLSVSEYDASTKNFIVMWSNASKIPVNFEAWKVYSDGTIINPYGNYLQMDYTSPALETADGFAEKEIWSNPRYSSGVITPYNGN